MESTQDARRRHVARRQARQKRQMAGGEPVGLPVRRRRKGQALVEFALCLPLLMIILLGCLNFGMVFRAWVELNQAVRVAANFAAENPTAWGSPGDATLVAEYEREIKAETDGINCTVPDVIPAPDFPSGTDVGSPASVTLTCSFDFILPILSDVVGNSVHLSASAVFPVRGGILQGIPLGNIVPTPTPTATPSETPTPEGTPTPTPTATPIPMCTVPSLMGNHVNQAQGIWNAAGFKMAVIFNPQVPPNNWNVGSQNYSTGVSLPCDTTVITVTP